MALAKLVSTPLAQKQGLQQATRSPVDASVYWSILGSLQYLTLTRPDISHVVNLENQFIQNPNSEHLQVVKRICKGEYSIWAQIACKVTSQIICILRCRLARMNHNKHINYTIYLGANCISCASN